MIKNWKSFNESQLDLFDPYIPGRKKNYLETYPYDEEQILDLLIDFEDEGYSIWVEHGFAKYRRVGDKNSGLVFTNETDSYSIIPATFITIGNPSETSDNITTSFRTFYNRIKTHFKEIQFFDNILDDLNRERLTFDGEIRHRGEELHGNLQILCVGEQTTVNDRFLFEYYRISKNNVRFTEKGKAILKLKKDFLITSLLSQDNQYLPYLNRSNIGPVYHTEDPSHYEVLSLLDKENLKKLIKKSKSSDIDIIYHDVELISTWEFKNLGESLKKMKEYQEIVKLYVDMDRESHYEKFFKALESEFKKWIEKSLKTNVVKTYTEDGVEYYEIYFQSIWIDVEYEQLYTKSAESFVLDNLPYEDFIPIIEVYGLVDKEKFNKKATEIIKGSSKT
jgi:hypothetical protein